MNRVFIPLIVATILTGCATAPAPPLAADNPANPSAPVAVERPIRNDLAADELTKETGQIFAQAKQEQEEQPSPTPAPPQQHTDQIPGMKM